MLTIPYSCRDIEFMEKFWGMECLLLTGGNLVTEPAYDTPLRLFYFWSFFFISKLPIINLWNIETVSQKIKVDNLLSYEMF